MWHKADLCGEPGKDRDPCRDSQKIACFPWASHLGPMKGSPHEDHGRTRVQPLPASGRQPKPPTSTKLSKTKAEVERKPLWGKTPLRGIGIWLPPQRQCVAQGRFTCNPGTDRDPCRASTQKLRASHGLPIWGPWWDPLTRTRGAREFNPSPQVVSSRGRLPAPSCRRPKRNDKAEEERKPLQGKTPLRGIDIDIDLLPTEQNVAQGRFMWDARHRSRPMLSQSKNCVIPMGFPFGAHDGIPSRGPRTHASLTPSP